MSNKLNRISTLMITQGFRKAGGVLLVGLLLSGCRGTISEKPAIHPMLNMDQQERKEAQEVNNFFEDGRSMRQPVEGTVARGLRKADFKYYEGVDENGDWIEEMPVEVTRSFLYRGQERFNIFCAPCHGKVGDGLGIIMTGQYGYVPAPTFHQDRLREAPDGEIYSAIYNGVRTMPSYAHQVPVEDRWAIVAYIRALQASQNVPEDEIASYDIDLEDMKAEYSAEQDALETLNKEKEAASSGQVATAERGLEVSTQFACQSCHTIDGLVIIGPSWLNLFGSEGLVTTADGESVSVVKDADYLIESILDPNTKIVDGFGPIMPNAYADLSENDLRSIIEYIKTLSDN